MCAAEKFATGNSRTRLSFERDWLVLDVGSGHNPHPRADVLVDRFISEDTERSGQPLQNNTGKPLVIADASALPFRDAAFDFSIASHIVEHLDSPLPFTREVQRISKGGYIETPSRLLEFVRHTPVHRWFVSSKRNVLQFKPVERDHPLGNLGRLVYSLYFYGKPQARFGDTCEFAQSSRRKSNPVLVGVSFLMMAFVRLMKPLTYMRFRWCGNFEAVVVAERNEL